MFVITVDGGLITGIHESRDIITEDTFRGTIYDGQTVIEIPEEKAASIASGKYLGEYDSNWNLKPLAQRVSEGLVVVPIGYIVDGDDIRPMTPEERIAAGLDEPPYEPTPEELEQQARQVRVFELKSLLAASDYKIIKCYEYSLIGIQLPYDIETLHAERQAYRDEINQIEEILQGENTD
jgi:hypothetical protein